jgi:transposase-like protein
MAKKGQKFNNYTKEIKEAILNEYLNNKVSSGKLSREYGVSENTIRTWARKARDGKDVLVDTKDTRRGRPKDNPNEIDYKERYEILKKYQDFIIARREKK